MARRSRRFLSTGLFVVAGFFLVVGCSLDVSTHERRISVSNPAGNGSLYPGPMVTCEPCGDVRAEIDRWVARVVPEHGPVAAVSFHRFVNESGQSIVVTRSGGDTLLAVVTLAHGEQIGLAVGCGIGIVQDACFARP